MARVPSSQATPWSGVRGTPVLALSGFGAIATWVSVSCAPRSVNRLQFPCLTTRLLPTGPADGAGEEAGVIPELQEDVGPPEVHVWVIATRTPADRRDRMVWWASWGMCTRLGVLCGGHSGRVSDTEVTGSLTHHLSCSGTMRMFQKVLPVLHCWKLKRRAAPACPRRRRCRSRGLLAVGEQQLGGVRGLQPRASTWPGGRVSRVAEAYSG